MKLNAYFYINLSFLLTIGIANSSLASTPVSSQTWQQKADSVCQQLQSATQAYQQGNSQQAHLNATMAYFQNYDTSIEPAARGVFQQSHIFQIEQMFSHLNASMVNDPAPSQIDDVKKQADSLCSMITADAKNMDAQQVKLPISEVN